MTDVVKHQHVEIASKRNWNFTLRALLVFVLLMSFVFAIATWHLNRFIKQEVAIKFLLRRSTFSVAWEEARPTWLWSRVEGWTGVRCAYVTALSYAPAPWTMADVECFVAMPRLRYLTNNCGVESDDVLVRLATITTLERLSLRPILVDLKNPPQSPGARGVQALGALSNLKWLDLGTGNKGTFPAYQATASDADFRRVAHNTHLEKLNLCATKLTIEAIRPLLKKECLESVVLPPSFAEHVDELLRCRSLSSITIVRLPEHIRQKAPDRLYGSDGGGMTPMGDGLTLSRDKIPEAWRIRLAEAEIGVLP